MIYVVEVRSGEVWLIMRNEEPSIQITHILVEVRVVGDGDGIGIKASAAGQSSPKLSLISPILLFSFVRQVRSL